MHGMPIAASLGIDCELNKQNTPHLDVKKLWEEIKNLGGFPKKIKPENLVYVGVRETEWQEDEIIKELPITLILRPFNFDTFATKAYAYASQDLLEAAALPSLFLIFWAGLLIFFTSKYILSEK